MQMLCSSLHVSKHYLKEDIAKKFNTMVSFIMNWRLLVFIITLLHFIGDLQAISDIEKSVFDIKAECGQICDTLVKGSPGEYFDILEKSVQCENLLQNDIFDSVADGKPLSFDQLPKSIQDEFTYRNEIALKDWYKNNKDGTQTSTKLWTKEEIDNRVANILDKGEYIGSYGKASVISIRNHIRDHFTPDHLKKVLVIGSQSPWLEALLISEGAEKIVTIEYQEEVSEHEQILLLTPEKLRDRIKAGDETVFNFDSVVSYSSIEHSGLGRYGDGINPWGDLIAMARAWCMVKPGGRALIGLPTHSDMITFNAHRVYGPVLLSHLFSNWEQVYTKAKFRHENKNHNGHIMPQGIFIVEKPGHIPNADQIWVTNVQKASPSIGTSYQYLAFSLLILLLCLRFRENLYCLRRAKHFPKK